MPTYEIKAPNGRKYRIQGPAGANDEQVRAEVLRQFPDAGKQPSYDRLSGDAAKRELANGERVLAQSIAHLSPQQQAYAKQKFYADPRIKGLMEATGNGDTRPTSEGQGFYTSLSRAGTNAGRYMELMPASPLALVSLAQWARGKPTLAQAERQRIDKQAAESQYQGGTLGSIAGSVIGSAPTMFLPGGPIVQGAAQGALMTENPDDPVGVATDMTIGAVTAKVTDKALRGGAKLLRGNPARQEIVNTANRLGVKPTPATTGGSLSQLAQVGLGSTPGGFAPVSRAVDAEITGLSNAARQTAQRLGPVSTPQGAGEMLIRGAKSYQRASRAVGGKLYEARTAMMGGDRAPVLMGSASKEIQSLANDFPSSPALSAIREHPAVRRLAMPDGAEPQLTLSEATDALSHIRAAVRNAERSATITGPIKARISRVEQAIENDVMRSAQAADAIAGRSPNAGAAAAQTQADAFWAQRSRVLQGPLKKAVDAGKGDVSPQAAYKQMVSDMQREGGNMGRLAKAWGALPRASRRTFSATTLDDMGRAGSGAQDDLGAEWSFNTFLTNYDKMAPEARKLVFGKETPVIEDIASYSSALRKTDKLRNFSNTARTGMMGAYLYSVLSQVATGNIGGALTAASAYPATNVAARVFMANPAMRLWTRSALKASVSGNEKAVQGLVRQLPVIATRNSGIREEVMALFNAVNDNVPMKASAGSGVEQDQQDQNTLQP